MQKPVKALCKKTVMMEDGDIKFMAGNEYDIVDYTPSQVTILSKAGLETVPMENENFIIKYDDGKRTKSGIILS